MDINLDQIGKRYDSNWIFRNVSASFSSGNVHPIIGRNGSGKSTCLQIISGYVTPNEGSVEFKTNEDIIEVEKRYELVSMAAPYLDLFDEFNVEESIALHAQLKGFLSGYDQDAILSEIELTEHRTKQLRVLSSGMRQRLKLALALCSESKILLLDEPCSNLDAHWMAWYNEMLEKVKQDRLVIIASNSQEEELKQANVDALDLNALDYR